MSQALTVKINALDAVWFTQQLFLGVAAGHGDLDALVVVDLCGQDQRYHFLR